MSLCWLCPCVGYIPVLAISLCRLYPCVGYVPVLAISLCWLCPYVGYVLMLVEAFFMSALINVHCLPTCMYSVVAHAVYLFVADILRNLLCHLHVALEVE